MLREEWDARRESAEPFGTLFFPALRNRELPANFSIPKAKRKRGEPELALLDLRTIAAENPQQLKAYIEMIDILIIDLKDPHRASEIYDEGMAALQNEADRLALSEMYMALCSMMAGKPQWCRDRQKRTIGLREKAGDAS